MDSLSMELQDNVYPGRGIVFGKSEDGKFAVIAYFIMGRSENSRNRVFVHDTESTESIIRTEAADPSKMVDPSLIIYAPIRMLQRTLEGVTSTIVTNGDQTDTIYHLMKKEGKTFEQSLRTREFEPDAPNYTPRISGLMHTGNGKLSYSLSILKSANGNPNYCRRFTFDYDDVAPGTGHFLHTYVQDGNPLPSFSGEPKEVTIKGDILEFEDKVWENLNEENKISLVVRYINLKSGQNQTVIKNKYEKK